MWLFSGDSDSGEKRGLKTVNHNVVSPRHGQVGISERLRAVRAERVQRSVSWLRVQHRGEGRRDAGGLEESLERWR